MERMVKGSGEGGGVEWSWDGEANPLRVLLLSKKSETQGEWREEANIRWVRGCRVFQIGP